MAFGTTYTSSSYSSWTSYLYQPRIRYGTSNDDYFTGGYGNDSLYGGAGKDVLAGNDGNDWLDGGDDMDALAGGRGNDTLLGGRGADRLNGNDGRDYLWGGSDDDRIDGGRDADTLIGGTGRDTFVFELGDSYAQTGLADHIVDWSSEDRIRGEFGGYAEFGAYVNSIEEAQWVAEQYQGMGYVPVNTTNIFIYNSATNTGYLLMDLDGDTLALGYRESGTYESGVVLHGAGNESAMSAANILY
jgi:serralysin